MESTLQSLCRAQEHVDPAVVSGCVHAMPCWRLIRIRLCLLCDPELTGIAFLVRECSVRFQGLFKATHRLLRLAWVQHARY